MKYKTVELINRYHKDNSISDIISYKNKINEEIVDVEDAKVSGYFVYEKNNEMFSFHLHISTTITQLCAITLEPTKVLVDFDTILFYTFKVADDDSFPIINNIIELDEEVWGEIILHMPLRVIKEGAVWQNDDEVILEKENPFSELFESEEKE